MESNDQVEGHVDSCRDPRRGDHVPLVDEAGFRPRLDGAVDPQELVEVAPVGGCRPAPEQPGVGQDERPGAHRRGQLGPLVDRAEPGTHLLVPEQGPRAAAAGNDEHVDLGGRVPRVVGQDPQAFGALDRTRVVPGNGEDLDVVFGLVPGPVGQDLPGAGPVELLGPVEQGDPYPSRHRKTRWERISTPELGVRVPTSLSRALLPLSRSTPVATLFRVWPTRWVMPMDFLLPRSE